ncbi:VacJ family lipoprotein [Parasaccharibacter sp. TMW 2.1886]|nr:VacJ family lipoprotein [Parasaccharibacter sp. TMW 2.1886]
MACTGSTEQHHRGRLTALSALVVCLALLSLGGCGSFHAKTPTDPDDLADYKAVNDPYEPFNRKMFSLNMWVYHKALRPVGRFWKNNIPQPIRTSVATLNETWRQPAVFFSDVGAGRPRRAGDSFMRFLLNMTTAGFYDVAQHLGYKQHETDPGMVMALWGVKSGPYIFLPGLGPTNFRDAAGYAIGQGLTPINYVPRGYGLISFNWGYNILGTFNTFADSTDQLDQLEHQSLDPYAFMRSAWQQQRQSQIDALKADHRATTPDWY